MLGGLLNIAYTGGANNKVAALGDANALVSNQGGNLEAAVGVNNVLLANGGGNKLLGLGGGNLIAATVGGNTAVAVGGTNIVLTELGGMVKAASGGLGKVLADVMPSKDAAKAIGNATAKLAAGINSGSGNDVVVAVGGNNVVYTGGGKDVVTAAGGNNIVLANGGDNVTTALGGNNIVVNTAGHNVVTVAGSLNVVVTGLGDGLADVSAKLSGAVGGSVTKAVSTFIGANLAHGDGNDVVSAIGSTNVVYTGSGSDVVTAIGANNVVWSGTGDDTVTAFGARNLLWGDAGADKLTAVGANNLLASGNYAETAATAVGLLDAIAAGAAATDLVGKAGLSGLASGQSGRDVMTAFGKNNVLVGGSADTTATALGVNNLVVTGAGKDVVTALGSKSGIATGAGDDVVTVIGTNNVVLAGEGRNIVTALGKANIIEGGSGDDVLTALAFGTAAKSVNVNGNLIVAGDGNNVETVVGKDNAVIGGSGKDLLVMVSYGGGNSATSTNEVEGTGQTTTSTTKGSTQFNLAWTGAGNDTAVVYGDHNVVLSDSGDDFLVVLNSGSKLSYSSSTTEAVEGADKAQTTSQTKLSVDTGINFVHAGDGNDTLILAGTTTIGMGGNGNDLIVSSGQNNVALGGAGDDVIIGLAEITVFNAAEAVVENDYESAGDWVGAAMNANFIRSQYGALAKGNLGSLNLVGNVIMGGDGNDTIFATNAGSYVGGGKGNDTVMGMGWGVIDHLLVGKANTLNAAWKDAGAGFDAITKYLNTTLTDEISKGWSGVADSIKTELAKATASGAKLADGLNTVANDALAGVASVTGLSGSGIDVASPLKAALDGGKGALTTAVNGISGGVNYVADADVGSALADAASWTGDALKTASNASGNGVDWLGKYLGVNLHLSEFQGADFFIAGLMAYTLGYKYAGNNRLFGGDGDDTFYSGMGNDALYGGAGKDTYVMSMGDGKDKVYDSSASGDVLKFTGNKLFSSVAMGADHVKANIDGADLVINYVDGGKSYAQFTVVDYAKAGFSELDLVDAAGKQVAALAMADLIARAEHGADSYAMAATWTADRLHTFADLLTAAITGGDDAVQLVGVATATV
ncbi:serralysin-like metalloprotease [Janthinobacterium sp. BJB412]|nr:serralysin-like metalloprotease [Janthinobacterium sp. BJB412]